SGSRLVTDDGNLNPFALLFAGSSTVTIANRIDLVLNRFGVSIDGFAPPPPGPLTDLAVTSVSGPSAGVPGTTAGITVTVKNVGNQNVSSFDVTLQDTTEHVTVGTQSVAGQDVTTSVDVVLTDGTAGGVTVGTQTIAGLAVGASATRTVNWNTAGVATNGHILIATQQLADNDSTNNARAVAITVNPPP